KIALAGRRLDTGRRPSRHHILRQTAYTPMPSPDAYRAAPARGSRAPLAHSGAVPDTDSATPFLPHRAYLQRDPPRIGWHPLRNARRNNTLSLVAIGRESRQG